MQRCTQVVAWILFALALGSCSKTKDETALVVTVWTDFAAPSELDDITLKVTGQEKNKTFANPLAAPVPAGKPALQMALVPGAGDNQVLTIEAVGSRKGTAIVWQKARVHFTPDQQHELVLFLGKICQAKACETMPLFTCDRGDCIKPVESGTELPVYTRGTAGSYPDAATPDHGDADGSEVRGDGDSRDAFAEAGRPEVPAVVPDTQLPDAAELDVPLATGGTGGGMGTGGVGGGGGATDTGLTGGSAGVGGMGAVDADTVSSGGRGGISATAGTSGTGGVDGGAVDAPLGGATSPDAPVDAPADISVDGPLAVIDAPVSPSDTGGSGGTDVGSDLLVTPDTATGPSPGPCDVYAAAATPTPCVAAYSMVRLLSKSYTGPLFQVRAGSSSTNNTMTGGPVQDIMPGRDGYVDASFVEAACGGTAYCTVSVLYDQSGNNNNLVRAPKGTTAGGTYGAQDDYESIATKGKVKAGGHWVYSLYMNKVEGYRTAARIVGNNMPTGSSPQGIYELADGTRNATACCWDFGNVITDPASGWAFADALCFARTWWGLGEGGSSSSGGPWFGVDFEGGVWAGGSVSDDPGYGALNDVGPPNPNNPSLRVPFALGFLRVNSTSYAIHAADLSTATVLKKAYEGPVPTGITVNHRGGIVLGVGTDNSNNSFGTFYEGAILAGYPDDDTNLAVMKNVQSVGYSKQ